MKAALHLEAIRCRNRVERGEQPDRPRYRKPIRPVKVIEPTATGALRTR